MDPERRGLAHGRLATLLTAATAAVGLLLAWEGLARPGLEAAERLALGGAAAGAALAFLSLVTALPATEGPAVRLGWVPGRFAPTAWCGGALGVVALSHGVDATLQLLGWGPSASMDRLQDALEGLPMRRLALVGLGLALIAPLGEELFFRGLLQRGLSRRLGRPGALVLASLLFGLAHAELALGVGAFCLGLALGWIFDRSGSLRLPCLAHILNNTIAVLELWGPVGLPAAATRWEGAVGGLLGGVVALAWVARRLPPAACCVPGSLRRSSGSSETGSRGRLESRRPGDSNGVGLSGSGRR